jgi:hypothetical protein
MAYLLVRLSLLNKVAWTILSLSRRMIECSLRTVFYDPQAVTRSLVDEVYQLAKKPEVGQAW